jgi:hypothetical protein
MIRGSTGQALQIGRQRSPGERAVAKCATNEDEHFTESCRLPTRLCLSDEVGQPSRSVMARPNFIELPTRDLAASQLFFENVFGMKMTGFGPTYACTLSGDVDLGL